MSTITRQQRAAVADWIPSPLVSLTVDKYESMVNSGVLTKRDRVHLINGFLVGKVSKNPPHVLASRNVRDELARLIPSGWDLRLEAPVRLPPKSEPEPDISMARGSKADYATRHPGPADLAMVVEIAESSVAEDRKMTRVYGPAGIPIYWIVNLKARQIEVFTLKQRGSYGRPRVFKPGQTVPVVVDGIEVGRIAVNDILPPIDPVAGGNGS
jgi:Uma2 family endonuclease